jgi:hypothetical protein
MQLEIVGVLLLSVPMLCLNAQASGRQLRHV